MKKSFSAIFFLLTALMIFSLSGCGGSSGGKVRTVATIDDVTESTYDIKQVAVITSPALEMNKYYRIYTGALCSKRRQRNSAINIKSRLQQ